MPVDWQTISKDLSANDPAQMLLRSSSAIPYQTVVALAESPRTKGVIYAGTDDGHLHVTRDGGSTWAELTGALPTRKWISRLVPSQHDEGTVYVTQRGREDDDFGVYAYKSTDFGKTWLNPDIRADEQKSGEAAVRPQIAMLQDGAVVLAWEVTRQDGKDIVVKVVAPSVRQTSAR